MTDRAIYSANEVAIELNVATGVLERALAAARVQPRILAALHVKDYGQLAGERGINPTLTPVEAFPDLVPETAVAKQLQMSGTVLADIAMKQGIAIVRQQYLDADQRTYALKELQHLRQAHPPRNVVGSVAVAAWYNDHEANQAEAAVAGAAAAR